MQDKSNKSTLSILRLSRAFVIALVSVLLLAFGSQFAVKTSLREQGTANDLVHQTAGFRLVGLKVVADIYALNNLKGSSRAQRVAELDMHLHQWQRLESDIEQKSIAATSVSEVTPVVAHATAEIMEAARAIVAAERAGLSDESETRWVSQVQTHEQGFEVLAAGLLHSAVERSEYRPPLTQEIQLGILLVTLIVLAIEFRYVLVPSVRRMRSDMAQLKEQEQESAKISELYQVENEKLKADQLVLKDIAASMESTNQRIESAARRFEELFQGLPIACFGYDATGTIFEWNRACEDLFHGGASTLFSANILTLLTQGKPSKKVANAVAKVFQGEPVSLLSIETKLNNETKYLLCSTFPVHGQNDQISGAIFVCVDLTNQKRYEMQIKDQLQRINEYSEAIELQKTELEAANARLASLASTDGLTGLQNHRSFQEALVRDCRRAERDGTCISLILLDLDRFKLYNDTYGHPAGDQLLRRFAGVLTQMCRQSDLVARYGGEEFVVILPSTNQEGAVLLAERIREAVEHEPWDQQQVTVSVGVSTHYGKEVDSARLIQEADKAMYTSKSRGRNRVTSFDELLADAA